MLFMQTILNYALKCYLNPTDLSSPALKAWEESIRRDYPAAWQPASMFQGCSRLSACPTLSEKKRNRMNLGSKGSAEKAHAVFIGRKRELFKNNSSWVCIYIYKSKIECACIIALLEDTEFS